MARRSWRELVLQLTTESKFSPAVTKFDIADAERSLGVELPATLREVLLESNGVIGQYGLGLVWPLERIKHENIAFRSNSDFRELYMPFDHLLFFADAGNGDQFAYAILAGEIRNNDVYVWNH